MTIQRTFNHLDPIEDKDSTTESGLQPTNVQRTEQFDYQEAVDEIQIELTAAENSALTALEHYRNVGERLETFEANCRHGQYGKMLKELGIGRTSAHNYRQLHCNWDLIKDQKGISQSKALAIIAASDTSQLEEQTIDTTAERVTEESPGNNPARQLRQSRRTTAPRRRALDIEIHTFNSLHHTTLTSDQLDNRQVIMALPPATAAELYRYLVYTCNQHPNKLPQPVQDAFLASGASFKPVTQQIRTTEASGQEVRRVERFVEIEVPPEANAETLITPSITTQESASQPLEPNGLCGQMPNDITPIDPQTSTIPEGLVRMTPVHVDVDRTPSSAEEIDALYRLIEQLQADITHLNERNEQLEIELAKQATTPQPTPSSFNALVPPQELEQDNQIKQLKKDNQTLTLELQKMAESNQQLREQLQTLQSSTQPLEVDYGPNTPEEELADAGGRLTYDDLNGNRNIKPKALSILNADHKRRQEYESEIGRLQTTIDRMNTLNSAITVEAEDRSFPQRYRLIFSDLELANIPINFLNMSPKDWYDKLGYVTEQLIQCDIQHKSAS